MDNKNHVQKILKNLNLDKISSKYKKGTESFTHISKNFTSNVIKNFQNKSNDLINSLKHTKLRNLEAKLKLDKSSTVSTSKKCYIYQTSEKTVIIDLDMWGDPIAVTTKTSIFAKVQTVKFLEDEPFIYPSFSEKNLFGQIINLDDNEIWYNDSGTIILLKFFGTDPNIVKLNLNVAKDYSYKDLNADPDFKTFLKNCSLTYRDKNLLKFLESKEIVLDNIIFINRSLIIHKLEAYQFQVLLLDGSYTVSDTFLLSKLPFKNEGALTALFSDDIVTYVKSNDYKFEDFVLNDNFIEYWQYLGTKKVCLLKCEINKDHY